MQHPSCLNEVNIPIVPPMLVRVLFAFMLLLAPAAFAADAVPATSYFPVLPLDALPDTEPQFIPLAASRAINAGSEIRRAIIVIHDETRDANAAVAAVSALAGTANVDTLILAPQFLLPSDIAHFIDHLPQSGRAFAAWQAGGWPKGDDSVSPDHQKGTSSFTVVDLLLMYLSDRKIFPHLRTVTVAGFGQGADFVQRYAAFSPAPDVVAEDYIDVRYLVAAPSSYLYLTPNRPLGGRKGWGRPDVKACPDYNAYPYGLDNLNDYARHTGANAAKTSYSTRSITYIAVPAQDANPDQSCAALAQGVDRASRTASFKSYLETLYGDEGRRTQSFSRPDAPNDAVGLFGSKCGMAVLFGDGKCTGQLEQAQ